MWLKPILLQYAIFEETNWPIELLLYLTNVLLFHRALLIEQILIDTSLAGHLGVYTTLIFKFLLIFLSYVY